MPTAADLAAAAKAMQESRAWPVVFKAGSAAELALAALTAVEKRSRMAAPKKTKIESLVMMGNEIADLAKSRRIQTEEGRAITNALLRLTETLIFGEPQTKPTSESSHHG